MGADGYLAAVGAHAEAGRRLAGGAEAVRVAIGLGGDRLVVAVLVGMVAVVRIAADQAAVLVVVRVVVMMPTIAAGSPAARAAYAMLSTVHGALRVPAGALRSADRCRHGRRIAALLSVMMVVRGAGRCGGRINRLPLPGCHCIAVDATAQGMWGTGRAVAYLPEGLDGGMDECAARGADQVAAAGRRCGCGASRGVQSAIRQRLLLSTDDGHTPRLALGRILLLPKE